MRSTFEYEKNVDYYKDKWFQKHNHSSASQMTEI